MSLSKLVVVDLMYEPQAEVGVASRLGQCVTATC